jgi:hypothetical protein
MKSSPYYPPRANALSRFQTMVDRLIIWIRMSQLLQPAVYRAVGYPYFFSWLLVPGLMWRGEAERAKLGNGVMLVWAACVVIHIVSLNTTLTDYSAIMASALHGISAAAVLGVLYPQWQGFSRVWKTSLYATLLVVAIYTIGLRNVMPVLAQRVTLSGETIMIRRGGGSWTQGEWVTYRLQNGMMTMERILAGPGDIIRFHKDSFEVNGKFFERISRNMPVDTEIIVGSGTYFIWPTGVTYNHAGEGLPKLLLSLTEIPDEDIVGRPYQRWFWKSTPLESLKPIPPPNP